jgi:large subunit ribosomal protein L2
MSILLFLSRKSVTSNASRQIKKFTSKWYDRLTAKKLTFRKKSHSGRSSLTGRIVVWTKGSLLRRVRLQKINYNFRTKTPCFISTFRITPFSNKLLSLAIFASGGCTYLPTTDHPQALKVFNLTSLKSARWTNAIRPYSRVRNPNYTFIHVTKPFTKVSNIELIPGKGVQYVRSSGTFAKIIKFSILTHTALIRLPSGVKKFFSIHSLLMLGACALKLKRKTANTRSGFWRSYGLKPKVRGVARNPVDHPHGGRTKAIKYPRTPWGKTTKFK